MSVSSWWVWRLWLAVMAVEILCRTCPATTANSWRRQNLCFTTWNQSNILDEHKLLRVLKQFGFEVLFAFSDVQCEVQDRYIQERIREEQAQALPDHSLRTNLNSKSVELGKLQARGKESVLRKAASRLDWLTQSGVRSQSESSWETWRYQKTR